MGFRAELMQFRCTSVTSPWILGTTRHRDVRESGESTTLNQGSSWSDLQSKDPLEFDSKVHPISLCEALQLRPQSIDPIANLCCVSDRQVGLARTEGISHNFPPRTYLAELLNSGWQKSGDL